MELLWSVLIIETNLKKINASVFKRLDGNPSRKQITFNFENMKLSQKARQPCRPLSTNIAPMIASTKSGNFFTWVFWPVNSSANSPNPSSSPTWPKKTLQISDWRIWVNLPSAKCLYFSKSLKQAMNLRRVSPNHSRFW